VKEDDDEAAWDDEKEMKMPPLPRPSGWQFLAVEVQLLSTSLDPLVPPVLAQRSCSSWT